MKKLIGLIVILWCLTSCEKEPFLEYQLPNLGNSLEFTAEGGSVDIEVSADCSYEVLCKDEWISTTKTSSGIKVTAQANLEIVSRETEIRILYYHHKDPIYKSIKVAQGAFEPILSVAETEFEVDANGGCKSIEVVTNSDFNIVEDATWITCMKKDGCIEISIEASTITEERSADITILLPKYDISKVVKVTQKAFEPSLEIGDATELIFDAAGGVKTVAITANSSFRITEDADWITCSKEEGDVKILVSASTITELRSANIIISLPDYGICKEIKVTQKAFEPQLMVKSESVLELDYQGDEITIEIVSNFDYDISGVAEWLTYEKIATGVKLVAPPNHSSNIRSVPLTISGAKYNIADVVIVITQGTMPIDGTIIEYTTNYGGIVQPYNKTAFGGSNILSNTYKDGKGTIVFDSPITVVGEQAFYNSLITSVTIPRSVTYIGESAFKGCSSLKNIYIAEGLTLIGNNAFNGCTALSSILIPDTVTKIGEYAFRGCSAFKYIEIPVNVTSIGLGAFYECRSLAEVVIGNGVTTIAGSAFRDCNSLQCITIPDSVVSIGGYAFCGCRGLSSIYIGRGVGSIGGCAFENCTGELTIDSKIVETDYANNNYPSWSSSQWLYGAKFTKLIIGDNVKKIGRRAFMGCKNFTHIEMGATVASIGYEAFRDCIALISINIPNEVTFIDGMAFHCCNSLININIPSKITTIGNDAFYGCNSLTRVDIMDLSAWCKIDFLSLSSNPIYYAKNLYLNGVMLTEANIPSDITEIKEGVFMFCASLETVTIPECVTSIGRSAFHGCSNLMKIYCKPIDPPVICYSTDYYKTFPLNQGMKIYVSRDAYNSYMQYSATNTSATSKVEKWYYYESYIEIYDF